MAKPVHIRVRISSEERELLEAAAKQSNTTLSDFIRRAAVSAADLPHQNRVIIPSIDWEKFEAWVDSPPKEVAALRELAKSRPVWRS